MINMYWFMKTRCFFCFWKVVFSVPSSWSETFGIGNSKTSSAIGLGLLGKNLLGNLGWFCGILVFFFVAFCFFFKMLVHFEPPFYVFCGGRCCKSLFFPLMKCKLLGGRWIQVWTDIARPFPMSLEFISIAECSVCHQRDMAVIFH